jgi:hypothetical protein
MLITNAILQRKVSAMETQNCVIEAIEVMSQKEFEEFSNYLLLDRSFIADKKDDMFTDLSGRIHCLLALNKESGDGILIDSSGYDYARYSCFMPNIKPYIEQQISHIADQMIREASEQTSNGSFTVSFEEIKEQFDITVKENNGIGSMLLSELQSRKEMAEITVEDGCFDMVLYLDFCKNIEPSETEQRMGM